VQAAFAEGVMGDVILVNGAPWPVLEVATRRYRFRLLNASNARRYQLRLDPPPPSGPVFTQIGSDNGLLPAPRELNDVTISCAERFDVVVDFSAYPVGTEVTLVNALGQGGTGEVMRFRVVRQEKDDSTVPAKLADVVPLSRAEAVRTRQFDFRLAGVDPHHWQINGHSFDPAASLAAPRLNTVELWRFTSDFHHPVHVHLAHFQVLSRNGGDPLATDGGWKDTVDIRPYEVLEVLVKFAGHKGRYMLHCHNIEHEDMAMMANFDVV
jgi:spore coat protein A